MEASSSIATLGSRSTFHISRWDSHLLGPLGVPEIEEMRNIIDQIGLLSAKAQSLRVPITSFDRIRFGPQRLYLCTCGASDKPGAVVVKGMLKVGEKNLFIRRENGRIREISPLCVLDFYVHESCQRSGVGRLLFEGMLSRESQRAHQLGKINLWCLTPTLKSLTAVLQSVMEIFRTALLETTLGDDKKLRGSKLGVVQELRQLNSRTVGGNKSSVVNQEDHSTRSQPNGVAPCIHLPSGCDSDEARAFSILFQNEVSVDRHRVFNDVKKGGGLSNMICHESCANRDEKANKSRTKCHQNSIKDCKGKSTVLSNTDWFQNHWTQEGCKWHKSDDEHSAKRLSSSTCFSRDHTIRCKDVSSIPFTSCRKHQIESCKSQGINNSAEFIGSMLNWPNSPRFQYHYQLSGLGVAAALRCQEPRFSTDLLK